MDKKFATAINCIDGRVQLPVIEWFKENHMVAFVDMITEPGPDKILSENNKTQIELIKMKVEISVKKHDSKLIALVGHHNCAGNPVDKSMHKRQIEKGIEKIRSWGFGISVVGLWIDSKWRVNQIISP